MDANRIHSYLLKSCTRCRGDLVFNPETSLLAQGPYQYECLQCGRTEVLNLVPSHPETQRRRTRTARTRPPIPSLSVSSAYRAFDGSVTRLIELNQW
jgi:hypothetical protein